jgi:16S rRNA processing protein RimM
MVLKFAGVDSISQAETLVGCELQVLGSERAELEPGSAYVSDLTGCTVFDGEHEIGKVADVQFGAGEAPLLVVKGAKEYEIPFAEAYLKNVDLVQKRIQMQLPAGMLDVNAPLTGEEKERQK